jgi:hypothetical protein
MKSTREGKQASPIAQVIAKTKHFLKSSSNTSIVLVADDLNLSINPVAIFSTLEITVESCTNEGW